MADSKVEDLDDIATAGGLLTTDLFYVARSGTPDLDFKADGADIVAVVQTNATAFVTKAAYDAHTILAATTDNNPVALTVAEDTIIGRITAGSVDALSASEVRTIINVEDGADVTDASNVDAAGAVMETDYNANTILLAVTDDTPTALTIDASSFIGRKATGDAGLLSASEARTILNVADGATAYADADAQAACVGDEIVDGVTDVAPSQNAVFDAIATLEGVDDTKASVDQIDFISGVIEEVDNQDYRLVVKVPYGGTITETTTRSGAGTCTATFKINTTALGGTANSVSTSEQSQAHASSNIFGVSDDIVLTVSSNSSCTDFSFTIQFSRTLDN